LPRQRRRSQIEVTLSGCRLGYLDVHDVYADPD
jgi:hypothetical protein